MRILFLLPNLDVGGLQRVQVTIANELSRRGHAVTITMYGNGDALAEELLPNVRLLKLGLKPHRYMRKIPWVRHRFYDDGMWEKRTHPRKLHDYYLNNEEYDIEIGFFRGLSIKAISGYSPNSKAKHFAWVHSDFRHCDGYNYEFKNHEAVFRAYKKMDAVICVSEDAKEGFIKTIGNTENCCVINNPLPVDEIIQLSQVKVVNRTHAHKLNIVLVGHIIDRIKGHSRVLNAISELVLEGKDIGLTIAGDGVDRKWVEELVNKFNLSDNVTFLGELKNPYPYIRTADLLVCASYYEGYNLTVAEALILGTPVLSTHCTGPVEILGNGKYGMIVENSTKGLTEGLREFFTNPQLLDFYKEKAKERLDFFNAKTIMDSIEALFYKRN